MRIDFKKAEACGARRYHWRWGWIEWLKQQQAEVFKERVLQRPRAQIPGYRSQGVFLDHIDRDGTMRSYLPTAWSVP